MEVGNALPKHMGNIAVVTAGKRRFPKVSPNKTLKQYQDALIAELTESEAAILPGPYYSIRYTFSRQLVHYKTREGGTSSRNWADVTNMQKGTEDALQGVYMPNDRAVIQNLARLVGPQKQSTLPYVVIEIRHSIETFLPADTAICPIEDLFSPEGEEVWKAMLDRELGSQDIQNNEWTP